MKSYNFSYDREIESAYIITVTDSVKSLELSNRCQESCRNVNMPFKVWDAVKWIPGGIVYPSHITDDNIVKYIKMVDCELSGGEFACALSHISLWFHCVKIDKPIVILEHDAVMVQPLNVHRFFNSIHYLGALEYADGKFERYPIPLMASMGNNYRFICRAHAYAIDPQIAKNLLAMVISQGVHKPLDIMMRSDVFSCNWDQQIYAIDVPDGTTIQNRNKRYDGMSENERIAIKNDGLLI